ncbi:biliverdin-producing heme oxygenase [Halomonas sp. LBP4]|uniref:biliverdin-producing heme oxygenase n=1 Tax=Halomonas sp. LBP4 TaxID=2044917 RepID=UPI0011B5CA0D|nr:biliverdin-producing heme oxygenase [Halomonas sp. LBP4]
MNESPCQLLDHLRQATRSEHHALDRHPRLNGLLRPGLDLDRYGDALLGLYPAQHYLEQVAGAAIDRLRLDYRLWRRTASLRDDMERLGLTPTEAVLPPMAQPRSHGELIGLLYVLEGSRLGARLLADRVRACLGADTPLSFFADAGGADIWPAFRRFVQVECVQLHGKEDEKEAAASMAQQAFAKFSQSLNVSRPVTTLAIL